MDDLLSEFLTETSESLSVLDVELVKLEQNPEPAILQNIFRLVHTIKGTCGFLGLPRLEHVAHASENVLGKFRDGELEVTPDAVTLILQAIDRIKLILGHLEQNECEPEGSDDDLIEKLNAMAEGRYQAAAPAAAAPAAEETPFPVAADLLAEVEAAYAAGKKAASDTDMLAEMAKERAKEAAAQAAKEAAAPAPEPEPEAVPEVKASVPAPTAAPPAVLKDVVPAGEAKESAVAAQTIRVNVELLENLMTLVSELVLTRNQLLQMVRGRDDSEFTAPLQRLSHITTDLQEGVMKTRMQPIGNAWAKLPRIVRDLSVEMGKKIDLQMLGAETELDRQVLELIKDPLTHMVRNSADHGLEGPDERKKAGKPEVGKVVLNAFHEGGHIIIEISDDGRGLNLDKIKQKAISNGLATESELESMTPQQIYQFIFKAGFSTAEKVTSVSGRGVGMDVVRTNIEKIGGTVELKSWPGKGSTFVIKIPLTLAIVSALIVECANERFAIPQISVLELVRTTANSEHGIEMINNAPVLRLRDRLLPLV
ncbi:MAG: chemotaxis protein CheA, partial [Bacteroidales bacterium]